MISRWPEISNWSAFLCLSDQSQITKVRDFAAQNITDCDELYDCSLLPLTKALLVERFYTNSLSKAILRKMLTRSKIGLKFYWNITSDPSLSLINIPVLAAFFTAYPELLQEIKDQTLFEKFIVELKDENEKQVILDKYSHS